MGEMWSARDSRRQRYLVLGSAGVWLLFLIAQVAIGGLVAVLIALPIAGLILWLIFAMVIRRVRHAAAVSHPPPSSDRPRSNQPRLWRAMRAQVWPQSE